MASQNFVGKGPSREILDARESRKAMERIKNQFMSQEELNELFEHLGIKISKKRKLDSKKASGNPVKKRPFVISQAEDVENAIKKFKPDPKAPYTYKTPKVKDPLKSRKPGRPVGSKKKRPNRNASLDSETSIEMSESELEHNDSVSDIFNDSYVEEEEAVKTEIQKNEQPGSQKIKRQTSDIVSNLNDSLSDMFNDSSVEEEVEAVGAVNTEIEKNEQHGRVLRKRKRVVSECNESNKSLCNVETSADPTERTATDNHIVDETEINVRINKEDLRNKSVKFESLRLNKKDSKTEKRIQEHLEENENRNLDIPSQEIEVDNQTSDIGKNEDNTAKKTPNGHFLCRICNSPSKFVHGVRAHYIYEHVWDKFEFSPIMKDTLENLSDIFCVDIRSEKFICKCGRIFPDVVLKGNDEDDFLGRQWMQVHRLVDPNHYNPATTHALTEVFPADLIVRVDVFPVDLIVRVDKNEMEVEEVNTNKKKSCDVAKTTKIVEKYVDFEESTADLEVSDDDLSLPDIDKYSTAEELLIGTGFEVDIEEICSAPIASCSRVDN